MRSPRITRLGLSTLSLLALVATACAPVGSGTAEAPTAAHSSSAPASSASPEAPPTDSPSDTPAPSSPTSTPTDEPTTAQPSPSTDPSGTTGNPEDLVKGENHIASAASYVYPAKQVNGWLTGKVKPTEKIVFLTFDDGPNHTTTPIILKALEDGGVHATFFVVGSMLGEAPDLLKREVSEGNSIGLHSWSHNYSLLYPGRKADAARVADEYSRTLAKVREILGPDFNTESWRYPGGHMSWKNMAGADAALAKNGVSWIDWNAMTGDAEPKKTRPTTAAGMVQMATQPIAGGYHVVVILAHDTPEKKLTTQAVPDIIKAYKDAGYKFGVIS